VLTLDGTGPHSSSHAEMLRRSAARCVRGAADCDHGGIDPEWWLHVPKPGVRSPGKDAEHVADGAAYHQWIVRLSLGHRTARRAPQ
jgi:hypothetical protein